MVTDAMKNIVEDIPIIVHSFDDNDSFANLPLIVETSSSRNCTSHSMPSDSVDPWTKNHSNGQSTRSADTTVRTSESNNSDDNLGGEDDEEEEESYGCFEELLDEDPYMDNPCILRPVSTSAATRTLAFQEFIPHQPLVSNWSGDDNTGIALTHEPRDEQLIFELEL